jgi:hypothetical protein
MMHRALAPALLIALGACVEVEVESMQVLVPEDLELHWDASFNGEDDGIAAVVPVDVMVYEAASGEPLEAIQLVLYAEEPYAVALAVDEVVAVEAEGCFDCELTWDAWRDRYVEVANGALDMGDEGLALETDLDGLARAYIHVDAFPLSEDGVEPIVVRVAMGTTDDAFLLTPR